MVDMFYQGTVVMLSGDGALSIDDGRYLSMTQGYLFHFGWQALMALAWRSNIGFCYLVEHPFYAEKIFWIGKCSPWMSGPSSSLPRRVEASEAVAGCQVTPRHLNEINWNVLENINCCNFDSFVCGLQCITTCSLALFFNLNHNDDPKVSTPLATCMCGN
jgi:hypothetical protein